MTKLVVFDFDGVFTNGKVSFTDKGTIIKQYNVKDGMGIKSLKENGIEVVVMSGFKENNSQREIMKHLKIDTYFTNVSNKLDKLNALAQNLNINLSDIVYMGDDINDIDIMKAVGFSACPNDAHSLCKEHASYISLKDGGDGCVRDLCDKILSQIDNKPVKVIDVTVRDGGFDNNWNWSYDDVKNMLLSASETGIDYFEVGYMVNDDILKEKDGHYRNVSPDTIKKLINDVNPKCKISVLIDYWRFNVKNLQYQCDTGIDLIRVVTYFDEPKVIEALESCKILKMKGYKVSLNIMCISYIDDNILNYIKTHVENNIQYLDFLYFADSYGSANPKIIKNVFSQVQHFRNTIQIGFHIHNNNSIGIANMISSLDFVDIVDASYGGMGRGAGNVKLEDVILYLAIKLKYKFNIIPFLQYINSKNNKMQIDHVKDSLLGLINVHPYRIRDYDEDISLDQLYYNLINLPKNKKYDYSID